jgi:hypothetical protein
LQIAIGGLATTALAGWTAYAFYKINDTAAYLMYNIYEK